MKEVIYKPYQDPLTLFLLKACFLLGLFVTIWTSPTLMNSIGNHNLLSFLVSLCISVVWYSLLRYEMNYECITVIANDHGVQIVKNKKERCIFMSWDCISFGYYVRNYRDGHYLLLSNQPLSSEVIKKALYWKADKTVICCIPISAFDSSSESFLSVFREHVPTFIG